MAIELNFDGLMRGPETLVAATEPVTLMAPWNDLGDEIATEGVQTLVLWLSLTIGSSVDARVRMLAKLDEDAANEYVLPIRTVGAAAVTVQDEYIEFANDANQDMVISWTLDGAVPYVQFQVQAGTPGPTPGTIDEAYVTSASRSA